MVEIGVALNAVALDATALPDFTQQIYQRRQLRVGKWVYPIPVVDELDGDGATAVMKNVMHHLVFGHANTQRPIAVYHVVNAKLGVCFNPMQVFFECARGYPNGLACFCIASGAARGMDDDHVDGLCAHATCVACLGIAGGKDESQQGKTDQGRFIFHVAVFALD